MSKDLTIRREEPSPAETLSHGVKLSMRTLITVQNEPYREPVYDDEQDLVDRWNAKLRGDKIAAAGTLLRIGADVNRDQLTAKQHDAAMAKLDELIRKFQK